MPEPILEIKAVRLKMQASPVPRCGIVGRLVLTQGISRCFCAVLLHRIDLLVVSLSSAHDSNISSVALFCYIKAF